MIRMNPGACPMPPIDWVGHCGDKKGMTFIGERTNEWLLNKVDAKPQEVYLNTDTNEYWMSLGYNKWEKWQGIKEGPQPTPAEEVEIYIGALDNIPEDISELENLEKKISNTDELKTGFKFTMAADEQYITIAYKTSIGPISSILESGSIEAISDFEKVEIDDYTFYHTCDTVYDEEGIDFKVTWGIN